MLENIEVLIQSAIRIKKEKTIYFDPFKIEKRYNDGDLCFITHSHYDHYSEADIDKIKKESTVFIVSEDLKSNLINYGIKEDRIITVKPNQCYEIDNIQFETVASYNTNKLFHPKSNNWVGYIITLDNIKYYIAGDTDINEDIEKVKCDVAFVPVGGTYTMDYKEAAELINIIKPKIAVPTHYGSIVGRKEDGKNFIKLLEKTIQGKLLMK